jgi:hypothetical protein
LRENIHAFHGGFKSVSSFLLGIPEEICMALAMLNVGQGMNSLRTAVCFATALLAVPPQGSRRESATNANEYLTVV